MGVIYHLIYFWSFSSHPTGIWSRWSSHIDNLVTRICQNKTCFLCSLIVHIIEWGACWNTRNKWLSWTYFWFLIRLSLIVTIMRFAYLRYRYTWYIFEISFYLLILIAFIPTCLRWRNSSTSILRSNIRKWFATRSNRVGSPFTKYCALS